VAVNASNPLLAGQLASQTEMIVGPVTIYSDYVYSMSISGTFQNGQTFSYGVRVEIVNGPSPGSGFSSSSITSSLSLPPPTTTTIEYGCRIASAPSPATSALVLVNTSSASNVKVNASVTPPLAVEAMACSYAYTNTTTPVACGVMCGGGIGYTHAVSDVWELNFSLTSPGAGGGYNLTISSAAGMGGLFPPHGVQVYLNSQQITTWYSNPSCYGGEGVEGNCMSSGAASMTIELPASIQSGTYQLVVSSAEYLVP
jgi:hypothetical protein